MEEALCLTDNMIHETSMYKSRSERWESQLERGEGKFKPVTF